MKTTQGSNLSYPSAPPSTLFTPQSTDHFADHEPGLWRAVITQALLDAVTRSQKSDARRTRETARNWLLSETRDFEIVCDNAGFDPGYVRRRAREALLRGCEWRLPNGQGWRSMRHQSNTDGSTGYEH